MPFQLVFQQFGAFDSSFVFCGPFASLRHLHDLQDGRALPWPFGGPTATCVRRSEAFLASLEPGFPHALGILAANALLCLASIAPVATPSVGQCFAVAV